MLDIAKLSSDYEVHRLDETHVDDILEICQGNRQFYLYNSVEPAREQILNIMHFTPLGVDQSCKYFVGFCQGETLIAVMDLIDGYPEIDAAYIGFFMMNTAYQGRQIGSTIIDEVAACLKSTGKRFIETGIASFNSQAAHFGKKNGFIVTREVEQYGWTALVAQRSL